MKTFLLCLSMLLSFQSSQSFFYGANVTLPQATTLATTINQCSTTADIIVQKLCQINKKNLKFTSNNFIALSNFLTDIQYVFQNTREFYNSFTSCLNGQTQKTTSDATIRNLKILVYQTKNYVITGFENNFMNSAPTFGVVFGDTYESNIALLANIFKTRFQTVLDSFNTLVTTFETIASTGQDISISTLNATLNTDPFNSMITALKEICAAESTFSTILDKVWQTVSALEVITIAIDNKQANSSTLIAKAAFDVDIASLAAKKNFADKIASYIYTIDGSMAQFIALASQVFVGDSDVVTYRQTLETYIAALKLYLEQISSTFTNLLTNGLSVISTTSSGVVKILDQLGTAVKNNLQTMIATSGSTIGPCFSTNTEAAASIISDLGFNATQCVVAQSTVPGQTGGLFSFIVEDVVIEALGVIDRMCSCTVGGDATTIRRSKACLAKVSSDLNTPDTGVLALEVAYIQKEFEGVRTALAGTLTAFNTCLLNMVKNFETNYISFNGKINVCMIG